MQIARAMETPAVLRPIAVRGTCPDDLPSPHRYRALRQNDYPAISRPLPGQSLLPQQHKAWKPHHLPPHTLRMASTIFSSRLLMVSELSLIMVISLSENCSVSFSITAWKTSSFDLISRSLWPGRTPKTRGRAWLDKQPHGALCRITCFGYGIMWDKYVGKPRVPCSARNGLLRPFFQVVC